MPTQFSATPPARHRFFAAGLPVRRARHAQHDLFADDLDRPREVHLALRQLVSGIARRAAEQLVERAVGHRQAGEIVEVLLVQPERAVFLQVDQLVVDQVDVLRLAVRREAHDLVFAGIDLEARVVRERGIQQTRASRASAARRGSRCRCRGPMPIDAVAHSPTPSIVRIAASSNGDGKNALAACDS